MYILRLVNKTSNYQELVVIKKGKALKSKGYEARVGSYNRKTNLLLLKYDLLWKWVGLGCHFSTSAYNLLRFYIS
jgi:hypothetical protein